MSCGSFLVFFPHKRFVLLKSISIKFRKGGFFNKYSIVSESKFHSAGSELGNCFDMDTFVEELVISSKFWDGISLFLYSSKLLVSANESITERLLELSSLLSSFSTILSLRTLEYES